MTPRHKRSRPCDKTVVAVALCWALLCAAANAADPLKVIPANSAGVVVFRNLSESLEKLNKLAKRISPKHEDFELDDLESAFNLEPGTLDPEKPVALILSRPTFMLSTCVIAFVPKDLEDFKTWAGEGPAAAPYDGPESDGFALCRDGVGLVSQSRRALRLSRPGRRTFMKELSEGERSLYSKSDVWIHLPLAKWRDERIAPLIMLASNFAKMGYSREMGADSGIGGAFFDLGAQGARVVLEEMQSFTAALRLDDDVIRFSHHHEFVSEGKVVEYLSQLRRTNENMLEQLPDVPFVIAYATNWQIPRDSSLSTKMFEAVCELKEVSDNLPEDERKKLLEKMKDCYAQTRGTYMLVGPTPGQVLPMRLLGGYFMEDASRGREELNFILEHAGDALASLLPTAAMHGKPTSCTQDGVSFEEYTMAAVTCNPAFRKKVEEFYGADARFQRSVADPHQLYFSLSQAKYGVVSHIMARKNGKTLRRNPDVRRIMKELDSKPSHAVALFDLGRVIEALPALSQMSLSANAPAHLTAVKNQGQLSKTGEGCGPLLAWSGEFEKNSVTGRAVISVADAAELAGIARNMSGAGFRAGVAPIRPAPPPPPKRKSPAPASP